MVFKVFCFASLLAVARAGDALGYSTTSKVSYPKSYTPVAHYISTGYAPNSYSAPSFPQQFVVQAAHSYTGPTSISHTYAHQHASAGPITNTYTATAPVTHTYSAPAPVAQIYSAATPIDHTYGGATSVTHTNDAHSPVAHIYTGVSLSKHTHASTSPLSYTSPGIAKTISYAAPTGSYIVPHVAKFTPTSETYAAPSAQAAYSEPSSPAHYDFGYSVSDPHTGDSKSQQESRRGDFVQGSYSLLESDGTKRIVEYTADAHSGFNAVVHKELATQAVKSVSPSVAKYIASAPVGHAAPETYSSTATQYAAPLSYAAPVTKIRNYAIPAAHPAVPSYYH